MANSGWKEEAESLHKLDSINVSDFHNDSFWAHLHYTWVWIMFVKTILVFCGEIWTCTILLVYGPTWSTSSATIGIDISVARWIFAASILLTCVLLALAFRKANRAIKSRYISSVVSNKVAGEFYRLQDYNYFCFFEMIRDSKKLHEKLSFLVVSQLKGWKFLAIQTPRQIVNIMTLFAFMGAIGFDIHNLGDLGQHFPELKNADVFTLCVMIFTFVMFICSVLATFAAMVLWIPLSPKVQGSLKSLVYQRMNKRIDAMVKSPAKQGANRTHFGEQRQFKYPSDDADPGSGGAGNTSHPQSRSGRPNPRRQKPTLPNIDVTLANSGEDARRPSKARNAQQLYQQQQQLQPQQQHVALETDHSSFQLQCRSSHYLQPDPYDQDPISVYPSPASSSHHLLKQASVTELSSSPIMYPSSMTTVTSPVLTTIRHSMRREQPQLQFYQNGALSHHKSNREYNQDYHDAYPRTPWAAPDHTLGETGLESWSAQHGFPAGEGLECTSPTAQQFMGSCRPDSGVLPEMTDPYYKQTASLESENQNELDAAVARINSAVYQPGKTENEQYNSLFKGIAESHERVKANRSRGSSRIHTRSLSIDPLSSMDTMEQQGATDIAHHHERYLPTPDSSLAPSSRLGYTQDPSSYDDPTFPSTALDPLYVTFMGSATPSPLPSSSSSATTSPCLSQRRLSNRQVCPSYQQHGPSPPSLTRVSTTPLRKFSEASISATQVAILLGNSSINPSRAASTEGECELDDLHSLRIDDMIEDLTASLETTPRSSAASLVQAPPRTASPARVRSASSSSLMVQGELLNRRTDGDGPGTLTTARATMLDSESRTSPLSGSLRTGNSLFEGQKRDTRKVKVKDSSLLNDQDGKKRDVQRVEASNGSSTDVSASEYDDVDLEDDGEAEGEAEQEQQIKQDTAHAQAQVYPRPKRSWTVSTSTLMSIEQIGSRSSSPVFKNRAAGSSTPSLTTPATTHSVATMSRPTFGQAGSSSMSRTSLELESWGESSLSLAKKSIEMARASIDRPRTPMERSGLSVEWSKRWGN